jgi:hypothetical protein
MWVVQMRSGRPGLSPERASILEALDGWTWDPFEDDWQTGLERLRAFVEREGHARVHPRYEDEDGFRLGALVNRLRTDHRQGKLDAERVSRLEAIDGWTWDPRGDDWQTGLDRLRAFSEREGHARVPSDYRDADGYRLGSWVTSQRTYYKQGKLSPDRVRQLEAVTGWQWDRREADWHERLGRLRCYVAREGYAQVPDDYRDPDGYRLGRWVSFQRSRYRRGKLEPDRADALEQLEGWSWGQGTAIGEGGI